MSCLWEQTVKVSELIMALKNYLTAHGDEEVVIYAKRYGDWDQYAVEEVERVKDEMDYKPGTYVILLSDREYKAPAVRRVIEKCPVSETECAKIGCRITQRCERLPDPEHMP